MQQAESRWQENAAYGTRCAVVITRPVLGDLSELVRNHLQFHALIKEAQLQWYNTNNCTMSFYSIPFLTADLFSQCIFMNKGSCRTGMALSLPLLVINLFSFMILYKFEVCRLMLG